MIDPFDSYKLYNALKLHFESDAYDAVKYNFHTTVNHNSFFKRKDKYYFAKLAKRYPKDLKEFYVSQFINDVKYVGDMMDLPAKTYYVKYKKVHESIHRVFEKDINTLSNNKEFDSLLVVNNINTPPEIIRRWMEEDITLETVVILDHLTNFMEKEGSKITETLFWPDTSRKINKYSPFVNFNKDKCKNIIKKRFTKP
jgi:hypothetical protein